MSQYDITIIGGDGIGPEVTREAFKVADAACEVFGFQLKKNELPIGSQYFLDHGDPFPDAMFEEARQGDAIFLGAIGDPRCEPGKVEYGIIAKCRFDLDLYVNLRPVKLLQESLCPLKGKGPADIDMLIVRENTEGAYTGMHGFAHKGQPLEVATQTMVYTREGVERAIRYAFHLAETRERQPGKEAQVTLVDKANAVRAHDLWQRTFYEVAKEHPNIKTDHAYIDAACMWMVKNPEWFDVAVTPNLFGDIITDLGAMIQGGMGMAASGNIHPGKVSLFEPIHGSAPKHAGKNVASPIAAAMAVGMMFDYLGEKKAAQAVDKAIADLFADGRLKGASTGTHPTNEVGDMIAAEIRKN
ncbi:D-malate dehydrogenase [decarboxylating] [Planctomycetes bacterium Poly30]|uniref:3-isopropylmalate dehydrogenase n=1 Tax=Saltatorellus ferox TaxID=2528018 RepID=A0A518EY08_9BACT|nr:D-malate dehydrogenase [decarboxylating] [Planctomycetes bacterium Poly30]